jgi:hypothetical protein
MPALKLYELDIVERQGESNPRIQIGVAKLRNANNERSDILQLCGLLRYLKEFSVVRMAFTFTQ